MKLHGHCAYYLSIDISSLSEYSRGSDVAQDVLGMHRFVQVIPGYVSAEMLPTAVMKAG